MPSKAVLPNNLRMTTNIPTYIDWGCLQILFVWGAIFIKYEAPSVKEIQLLSMQNLCSY